MRHLPVVQLLEAQHGRHHAAGCCPTAQLQLRPLRLDCPRRMQALWTKHHELTCESKSAKPTYSESRRGVRVLLARSRDSSEAKALARVWREATGACMICSGKLRSELPREAVKSSKISSRSSGSGRPWTEGGGCIARAGQGRQEVAEEKTGIKTRDTETRSSTSR